MRVDDGKTISLVVALISLVVWLQRFHQPSYLDLYSISDASCTEDKNLYLDALDATALCNTSKNVVIDIRGRYDPVSADARDSQPAARTVRQRLYSIRHSMTTRGCREVAPINRDSDDTSSFVVALLSLAFHHSLVS
jgi:hypothetical protein